VRVQDTQNPSRPKLRVAYFIDSLFSGGAQRQAVALATALAQRSQIEARFFVYHEHDFFAKRLEDAGIPVELVPKRRKLDPGFPWRLRRAVMDRAPDLVHAFLLDPSVWAVLALKGPGSAKHPPLVASERCSLVASSTGIRAKQTLAYRAADAVTSNSKQVAAALEAELSLPRGRVHYIPNGIDLASWDEERRAPLAFAFEVGKFHLGMIGRLEPEKNHILLIEALSLLDPAVVEHFKVWFIGSEAAEAGCKAEIEAAIADTGLADTIEFVAPQRHVAAVMAQLDTLVLPSAREAFPNAVLEAMASQLPVVATGVGDVPELVQDGRTGFVVEPGNARALAAKLCEVYEMSAAARRQMGIYGRSHIEDHFRIDTIADAYLELYHSLACAVEP